MAPPRTDIASLVHRLVDTCADNMAVNHVEGHDLPDKASVERVLDLLLAVLFPGYIQGKAVSPASLPYYFGDLLVRIAQELTSQVERAFAYDCRLRHAQECQACDRAQAAVATLMDRLPDLRQMLKEDVQAAYDHDPAAESLDVILFCYPGIEAIASQRLAHVLYEQDVPIIPRMWTERAHSRTGIDINPGARIGRRFFIDHGTGVVVGESTVIGDNVSLYQGVTLGALSPSKGQSLRSVKRHPTIEDDVIIYAGATILGGDTVIGQGSTIGGSVWLTESVPPGSRVMMAVSDLVVKKLASRSERLAARAIRSH
ncbi:MAG: serine O-acetyltransferase [Planctomycetes bacterium]|nr:serine O-acetyltransferase [Planctomycetota bacterium]